MHSWKFHALRYSIPIAFVGFPTYLYVPSSLSSQPSFSTSLSLFLFMYASSLCLCLSLSLSRHACIFTCTTFWPRVLVRLVEGLLPVWTEISARKFRSLAASESTTKLDINLPDYPDAILCPSVSLRAPSCLSLSLDTNRRPGPTRKQASCYRRVAIAKDCRKSEINYFYDKSGGTNISSLKSLHNFTLERSTVKILLDSYKIFMKSRL